MNQEKNQILFNDEDDDFMEDFAKEEQEAESFLDREKKKNDRKEMKATDHEN